MLGDISQNPRMNKVLLYSLSFALFYLNFDVNPFLFCKTLSHVETTKIFTIIASMTKRMHRVIFLC